MKKTDNNHEDMLPEYDFSRGVRGKHYKSYRQGHQVEIYKQDGSKEVKFFTLQDGAVMLDPDLQRRFPTSDAVNQALRSLLPHS